MGMILCYTNLPKEDESHQLIRVNALHALKYCPRLFYLEEVEELYVQDDAVFSGRRLHVELDKNESGTWENLTLEDSGLGIRGKVDAIRTASGELIPYEHKRGKCRRNEDGSPGAWESDRIQVLAYAMLIEKSCDSVVREGRIRYHSTNTTVVVPLDERGRMDVLDAIQQAKQLRVSVERPPVTDNEKLCVKCSLAPVCLPEEARLADSLRNPEAPMAREFVRLFPADDERKVIHVVENGSVLGKAGEQIRVTYADGSAQFFPVREVGQIVIHGFAQVSTQLMRHCSHHEIGIHYLTGGGNYSGSFFPAASGRVQRRIRQFTALSNPDICLRLAKQLMTARADSQRQVLMRYIRKNEDQRLIRRAKQIKILTKMIDKIESIDRLRGFEGSIAALYFSGLPEIISTSLAKEFGFNGRNRRPPRDRINALLSFGYALLMKDMVNGINAIGLDPAFGFYHQPRSSAPPLALDLMEIFRVPLVDMPVINSINRTQWDPYEDFTIAAKHVWLSANGKRKFIQLYEKRKTDTWKHPVIGYSLSYSRMIELEVRLLEKEWMDEGGLFAQARLR